MNPPETSSLMNCPGAGVYSYTRSHVALLAPEAGRRCDSSSLWHSTVNSSAARVSLVRVMHFERVIFGFVGGIRYGENDLFDSRFGRGIGVRKLGPDLLSVDRPTELGVGAISR